MLQVDKSGTQNQHNMLTHNVYAVFIVMKVMHGKKNVLEKKSEGGGRGEGWLQKYKGEIQVSNESAQKGISLYSFIKLIISLCIWSHT